MITLKNPRFDYEIKIETLNNEEYAVQVTRGDEGTLSDVVRKIDTYRRLASNLGLIFIESTPLVPTENLLEKIPKYKIFKDVPHSQMLIFEK